MSEQYQKVPEHLRTHEAPAKNEIESIVDSKLSGQVVPENMRQEKGSDTYIKQKSPYTANTEGLTYGAAAGTAAAAAQKSKSAYDFLDTKYSQKPSLQNYANSQLGDRNLNIPLKDFPKVTGFNVPATTPALVQRHVGIISGQEATPDTFKEIYKVDPKTGQQVLSHIEKTPGSPAVPPLDPAKLTEYEKNAKYHMKKHGELPFRASVAGYDIGKGLAQLDSPAGYADIGAGVAIGAAPWLPKKVKGVPVRAIATGLGLLPGASEAIGSAVASPTDVGGAVVDYATGLMSPTELGVSTTQPRREVYQPGMEALRGSTLQPQQGPSKSLLPGFAGGGETGAYVGYPQISNKPRDPNFVQQSGPFLGGLDAVIGMGPRSDVSLMTPQGQAYHEAYSKMEPAGIAANVLPFIGGPTKALGKSAVRTLGPKASDMAENYLARIGGLQYAVPNEPKILRASEALNQYADKGLKLGLTQSDNFGVHGGRFGGNRFPTLQEKSPLHAKDSVVWMNDTEEHANKMIDQARNNDLIWSTYIGAPNQLKSNKSVTNEILNAHYARNLTPEQIAAVNNRIASVKDSKKRLIFPEPFDIRDKFAVQELGTDTFARRGELADILGEGIGVGRTKGGIALPNYQDILRANRDPLTEGVPTSSIGTQLFKVDPNTPSRFSTDYHPDYNYTVHGKNTGVTMSPFPHSALDWHDAQVAKTGLVPHGNAWFNYMNTPQEINDKFLSKLHKMGHAAGGSVLPDISFDMRSMPSMSGQPGIGYMQAPQGAMARMQMEKELGDARLRAGVSGMGMAIPGQQGVKLMPGQMDIGANFAAGPGRVDISANRSINPVNMPAQRGGHMQGINARYTIPFANGGEVTAEPTQQDIISKLIASAKEQGHF